MIQHVPPEFQPPHPIKYPGDNHQDFERWFLLNYKPRKRPDRAYLPVMWTAYYCKNGYGQQLSPIDKLQKFLDALPDKPYYTIAQYDDGILNDLSRLDIKVFSMSGRPMDYPLPLICMPHGKVSAVKDTLFNFIGRNTHPIRKEILKLKGGIVSDRPMKMRDFCTVLSRSVYTLCPRGYGPTSFRIMEALEQNSIPVYVSDKFIIPHALPFSEYGVLIRPDQVKDIPSILRDTDPTKFKNPFQTHFTYEACQQIILNQLNSSV